MIDFHTHVLPGMDDGSVDIDETEEMLALMARQGISVVAATPHYDVRRETIQAFLVRRKKALDSFKKSDKYPKLVLGAEVLCSGLHVCNMDNIERLCIGNTRHLLVETHLNGWQGNIKEELLSLIRVQGITPILAHIERYSASRANMCAIRELKENGAVLQMNAGGFLNRKTAKRALRMLKNENVDLVCSDCHGISSRLPNLAEAMEVIREAEGAGKADELMLNAQRIYEMGN